MLARSHPVPHFDRGYRRVQDCVARLTKFPPPRENIAVSFAANFDDDVGIDQDVHSFLSLSMPSVAPQAAHVFFGRVGQVGTIFPDSDEGLHGFTTLIQITEITLSSRLTNQIGDGRPLAAGPCVEGIPQIVVKIELGSSHDVYYTSPFLHFPIISSPPNALRRPAARVCDLLHARSAQLPLAAMCSAETSNSLINSQGAPESPKRSLTPMAPVMMGMP